MCPDAVDPSSTTSSIVADSTTRLDPVRYGTAMLNLPILDEAEVLLALDRGRVLPALVTSISTNSPGAHEIDPASLGSYDVYCDYRATAPVTAGEMTIAVEAGEWSDDRIVADLAELATGSVPKEWTRPRFFRSTGLGIEDLAIAHLLVS